MKTGKTERLDVALRSGRALTVEALGHHLGVDRNQAPGIARAHGLTPARNRYSWCRIWRQIHKTEGSHLANHLAALKERHPGSVILAGIEDLEAALRLPLIDFAAMATQLGAVPDTLSSALRQGRETLPVPMLVFGPRLRRFRPLEVRLWAEEEIRLDLPPAISFDVPTDVKRPQPAAGQREAPCPGADVKKALFAGFARHSRSSAA